MKRCLMLAAVLLAGCETQGPPPNIELLGECFAVVAYETVRAENSSPPPAPEPQKCCGKCKGGLVRSGDGIEWVPCPCEDSCPCKATSLLPPKNYGK